MKRKLSSVDNEKFKIYSSLTHILKTVTRTVSKTGSTKDQLNRTVPTNCFKKVLKKRKNRKYYFIVPFIQKVNKSYRNDV